MDDVNRCSMCDDGLALVMINGAWYCSDHIHHGFQAATIELAVTGGRNVDAEVREIDAVLRRAAGLPGTMAKVVVPIPEGVKLSWDQPICEACWIGQEAVFDENRLTSIPAPFTLPRDQRALEACAWCGQPTIVGIYKREDPANVPYPAREDDDG